MLLKDKKILIMGIRNKWSIAYGIAKSAYDNGAKLIFTYMGEENKDKIEALISEFEGSKAYVLDGASEDELVREVFTKIKEENGKIDGLVHAIAHANTIREDLKKKGYHLYMENPTNQIFVVMENSKLEDLKKEVAYGFWEKYDEAHTVIRIATSWATENASVEALKKIL